MTCSRCTAEAVVKRGNASYCAKCAMARDWEDIIALVQEERVDMTVSERIAVAQPQPAADQAQAAKPAPQVDVAPATVAAESNGGDAELPADPFA